FTVYVLAASDAADSDMDGIPDAIDTCPATADNAQEDADGDGRFLLNQAETLFSIELEQPLGPAELSDLLHRRVPVYDKDREGHYNLISALHKSIRGSDPQAALYYLARMLTGEAPVVPPPTTMLGALYRYLREADPKHFQPMNANFGLVDELPMRVKDKRIKREKIAERALNDMERWWS
ncbi:MAG: hypothetical protein ABR562_09910, partial [Thermoplasmatota archaeon]